MENLVDIGSKLRAARQENGLSLRELSAKADVSPSLLSQIENGKVNPSVMTLHSIATALNVPIAYFFPSNSLAPVEAEMSQMTASEVRAQAKTTVQKSSTRTVLSPADPIVEASERSRIELMGGVSWERLTAGAVEGLEFLQIEYAPGGSSGSALSRHPGREFGYVLEGELSLELGFDQYTLHPGDSVVFNSTTPHRLTNASDKMMRAIWIIFDCPIEYK